MIRGVVNTFNRGEVDQKALAREDIKRVTSSASSMVNFIPSRLGNMAYRPGTEYITDLTSIYDNRFVPFVFSITNSALVGFYGSNVRYIVNEEIVATDSVTSTITNYSFAGNITGWSDASTGGSSIGYRSAIFTGYPTEEGGLYLHSDGSSIAAAYQTVTNTEIGAEHFLTIRLSYASVRIKIGTDGASSSNIYEGVLKPGRHTLTFTPTANFTITFESETKYEPVINSAGLAGGAYDLKHAFPLSTANLESLRTVQSGDIIFCTTDGGKPFQIEHRGDKSWSVVDFRCEDGPFESVNSSVITMKPAAINADTTLTSSVAFFKDGHAGQLFKLVSAGQTVYTVTSSNAGAGTNSVRVTGVSANDGRKIYLYIMGTFSAGTTVRLQRSADDLNWTNVISYTTSTTTNYSDGFDNAEFYYRLYIEVGDNASLDTISLNIEYPIGSIEGIGRVTRVISETVANIQVLKDFGSTDATLDWYEGSWSEENGYPSSVELEEGRLWFASASEVWGSVSDSYYSFDRSIEGDSASILRTIGFGTSDPIKWIKASNQLILGTAGDEIILRSSAYGEAITQNTANIRRGTTQGSANNEPVKVDSTVYFVQRSGVKIYGLDGSYDSGAFTATDINLLNQDITAAGIHRFAYTMQPETRLYVVLDDGTVAVYTVDQAEEVAGWSRIETDGLVKDVCVLPDADEDSVYFVVERTGGTYLEKQAKFKNAIGGTASETFDSFKRYTSPGTTITGLSHLEGKTVGVWADGQYRGTFTVSGSSITVPTAWTSVIVGLPYVADYVSNKLSGYKQGHVLTKRKRIVDTGLVMMNYWPNSLKVGPTVALLKPLPAIENGKALPLTATITDYSELPFEFDSETESDPRIYMRATGPCTILALTYGIDGESPDTPGE